MSVKLEEIVKITPRGAKRIFDPMIEEYPVTLYLNGQKMISLMSTPQDLKELGVGFFYLKGLIKDIQQVNKIEIERSTVKTGAVVYIDSHEKTSKIKDFFELSEESILTRNEEKKTYPFEADFQTVLRRYGLNKMLLTTGRIPSEVMTWIIQNDIRCVLSISAPTNGSVQLARKHGVTLMGFVRGERLNLYA